MPETDCVFCKIVSGEIEAEVVADEEDVMAFKDINGRAPVHVLVVPKQHVESLARIDELPDFVSKRLFEMSSEVVRKFGVEKSGYTVRINNGSDAGQEVPHLHLHVLGGERIGMP